MIRLNNYWSTTPDFGWQEVMLSKYNLNIDNLTFYQAQDFMEVINIDQSKDEEAFNKRRYRQHRITDI